MIKHRALLASRTSKTTCYSCSPTETAPSNSCRFQS